MRVAVLVVLSAGCVLPLAQPDAFAEPGAFSPRVEPPRGDAHANDERACLEIAPHADLSAFRPGIPLHVDVTVVNCGADTLFLAPACVGHVAAWLLRGEHAWRLERQGDAMPPECDPSEPAARELAARESLSTTFVWNGFLRGDACGGGRWNESRLPASPGRYQIVTAAQSAQGLVVRAALDVEIMEGDHELAPRLEEGGGGFRTLGREEVPPYAEKPYMLLTRQSEWADFCGHGGGERPLGWPYVDFARESVLVARWACVHGVTRAPLVNVTQVFVTRCDGAQHVVAIPSEAGEIRLVDLGERFAAPHDPPTADPRQPYAFDPSRPAHLARDADGTLAPAGGEDDLDPTCADWPPLGPASDPDGDNIANDLEALMAAQPHGSRVSAIVGMRCAFSWNDVLALRADVGTFPVNAVWGTGVQAFSADLTVEQVRALATRSDVRSIEGNGRLSIG